MAQLKITSNLEGLTPSEAAQLAAKYPHSGRPQSGPQIDGDTLDLDALDLSRRWVLTPDDKAWTVPDGETMWSDPRTAEVVRSWEKAHLKAVREKVDGWSVNARTTGKGKEYDRYVFSLSKDDAARLGPEGVEKAFRDFLRALRTSPWGSGSRMLEVEPLHQTEEGHIHVHVTAHRHASDPAAKEARKAIVQGEIHDKEAERLVSMIEAALTIEYLNGSGGRGISEESREATSEAIREAGGEPTPEMAGASESASAWVMPTAEQERIEKALREVERRIARREEEKRADADLYADLQNGLAAIREREALAGKLATVGRERDDLADQLAVTTDTLATTATERDDLAAKLAAEKEGHALTSKQLDQAETRAKRAEDALAGIRDELRERTDELTAAHAELESEKAETAAAIEQRDGLARELEAARAEAVKAREEAASERAEAAIAIKESERLAEALAAAQAEAEQVRTAAREATADRDRAVQSLDTIRAALTSTEGALASLKEQAVEAEEADAVPPGGVGLDGVGTDRRRRDPAAAWPKGAEYRRSLFGRARIETADGATLRVQRGAVRLAGGSLTPDAIAAMVTHARREGWVPIAVSGDERTRAALAEAARAAGLTLEGEEPGLRPAGAAPAAPAQAPAAPLATAPVVAQGRQGRQGPGQTFRAKLPGQWSSAEREAAGKVFEAAQERARQKPEGDRERQRILALTLDDWGKAVHDHWRKENPEASDGDKPKTPKP